MTIKLNHEQGLYVVPVYGANDKLYGYSTLGFDHAHEETKRIAEGLGRPDLNPKPEHWGTHEGYRGYEKAIGAVYESGKRLEHGLHPQLKGLEGKRVEVERPDGKKRRFLVGKSTGVIPAHIEIIRRNLSSGPAILPKEKFKSVKIIKKSDQEEQMDLKKSLIDEALRLQKSGDIRDPFLVTRLEQASPKFIGYFIEELRKNKTETDDLNKAVPTAPAGKAAPMAASAKPAAQKPLVSSPGKQIHLHIHTEPMQQNLHHAGQAAPAAPKEESKPGVPAANQKATRLAAVLRGAAQKPGPGGAPAGKPDSKTTPVAPKPKK